ncbi:MAG: cytochrome c [Dehalococcoidia bacterium]
MTLAGVCTVALGSLIASACGESTSSSSAPGLDAALVAEGQRRANSNGCIACHTLDGKTGVGPTWKGPAGRQVQLADGSSVMADDAYLRESVVDPNAKVVKGFAPGIMPATFGRALTDQQVRALVEYMKSVQ